MLSSVSISYQQVGDDLNLILNDGEATTILSGVAKDDFHESTDMVEF